MDRPNRCGDKNARNRLRSITTPKKIAIMFILIKSASTSVRERSSTLSKQREKGNRASQIMFVFG